MLKPGDKRVGSGGCILISAFALLVASDELLKLCAANAFCGTFL